VAVWINRYSKHWQEQFDMLAAALGEMEEKQLHERKGARRQAQRNGRHNVVLEVTCFEVEVLHDEPQDRLA
jgi:hypothetical protein